MKFVDHLNERSAANKYAARLLREEEFYSNFTAVLSSIFKTSGNFTFQSFFLGDFAINMNLKIIIVLCIGNIMSNRGLESRRRSQDFSLKYKY